MKEVSPWKILLLLLLVHALLLGVVLLMPDGKLKVAEDVDVRFLSLKGLLGQKEKVEQKSIQNILQKSAIDTGGIAASVDSLPEFQAPPGADTSTLRKLREIPYQIAFRDSARTDLDAFFQAIDSIPTASGSIRVFHYGDSQIEGDRITGTVRDALQKAFGGCGMGLLPVWEVNESRGGVTLRASEAWEKRAIYGVKRQKVSGPLAATFTFKPSTDSAGVAEKPWWRMEINKMGYARARRYEEVKVLTSSEEAKLNIKVGKRSQEFENLTPAPFQFMSVRVDTPAQKLEFSFSGKGTPNVYATALDCRRGIQVDNIAMRGSSGTDFHRLNIAQYAAMAKALNVKMLILQYGVNVVPYVTNDYKYYEKQFNRELMLLRNSLGNIPILVIGVSDMSTKGEFGYETYPNVERIRDAQRNAAFKAGCAYWDLYEAMGGKNSMPQWVNAQPALAEKDYTHFSARGARLIGQMISNALLREYYIWKERNAQ